MEVYGLDHEDRQPIDRLSRRRSDDNTLDRGWVKARLAECERWGCHNMAAVWREQLEWLDENYPE